MSRSRLAGLLGLVGLAGVASAGILAPRRVDGLAATGHSLLGSALSDVPVPVLVGGVLVAMVVLWFVAIRYVLWLAYRLWRRVSNRLYWALTLVLPETPLVKFASGAMVLIAVVILIVAGLPALVGGDEAGPEWRDIVEGDVMAGEPACDDGFSLVDGRASDRDGDGLPDDWERAGETPAGAALPGADPGRKDLYVQLNYGAGVDPVTDTEARQLRESWATMPVENPDGSTGFTLHLDDESPGAGRMADPAMLDRRSGFHDFYVEEYLGPRQCVYRQVVYGQVNVEGIAGIASGPGYAAFVTGERESRYEGTVSYRVSVTNHELLHTAVGRIDGSHHTVDGWLSTDLRGEYLSTAAARDVNQTGIHGPAS